MEPLGTHTKYHAFGMEVLTCPICEYDLHLLIGESKQVRCPECGGTISRAMASALRIRLPSIAILYVVAIVPVAIGWMLGTDLRRATWSGIWSCVVFGACVGVFLSILTAIIRVSTLAPKDANKLAIRRAYRRAAALAGAMGIVAVLSFVGAGFVLVGVSRFLWN